ncbi:hypothetical protein CSOJ01_06871 [Colletotrichum sojae]|uniref:Uncharacterized protein n=1 Tax=Colletotrichum sojae TaxID=2175907 RepID=A0A8H6MV53_9PEZI|nr:hypothetical protein CSOJ01_06871 [Colletotrichum sojae]
MPTQRSSTSEAEVKSWGFPHVFTWTDGPYVQFPSLLGQLCPAASVTGEVARFPTTQEQLTSEFRNAHYPPHSHRGLTTHLIVRGSLTITYPKDERPEKVTYGVGDRIDVDAGRVHEVWIGDEGCTYVIGE